MCNSSFATISRTVCCGRDIEEYRDSLHRKKNVIFWWIIASERVEGVILG